MRHHLPAAAIQSRLALYDHLPQYLDEMARTLAGNPPGGDACGVDASVCKVHGEQRAGLRNYSLKQVIIEYEILRETESCAAAAP